MRQVRPGFEVIGEFSFLCGEWWECDYYHELPGNLGRWFWVAGEYWPMHDPRWLTEPSAGN